MSRAEGRRALPLWLTVVLGVAGAVVALRGMHTAAPILSPVLLAFVLTVVAHPLIGALTRRRVPQWLAVALTVLAVDGGLVLFGLAVVVSVGQLATVLPQYADEWQHLVDGLRATLSAAGIGPDQVTAMLRSISPQAVVSGLTGLLSGLLGTVGALVLLLATALFMGVESAGLPERLAAVPGASPRLGEALDEFARGTRRYIVVTTVFGFAVAVLDTLALYLLGVPLALLWGLLSFLTNYVPNIGFFLGLAPPTLLAVLVGGPWLGVLVVISYSVINFLLQSVLQPVVVGDVVGLSVTLSFLSVIGWTFVLGPLGAILAIPLTLLVIAVLVGQDPERRWARTLLAGRSAAAAAPAAPARPRPPIGRPAGRRPARAGRPRTGPARPRVSSPAGEPPSPGR